MGRKTLGLKNYTPEQVKDCMRRDERYTVGLRLYAVYQISLGKPARQLEELYQTSFKQLLNWAHRFDKEGIEGLKDKPGRGRKSRLTPEQMERLRLLLKENPENHGYNSGTWTGPLLIDWLEKNFQVTYKKVQIYNLLKSMGFTYQKGKGFYPEANADKREETVEALKKTSESSAG